MPLSDKEFHSQYTHYQKLVDESLRRILPSERKTPSPLHKSMRYSVLSGGKRIRPILCMSTYSACGKDAKHAAGPACALELIHAYSLIHDDLPCMDNDDMRRGKPTNHRVFGEAIATLAGDALQPLAFETLLTSPGFPTKVLVAAAHVLAHNCGSLGLVGGQTIDIISEGKAITPKTLKYIHANKTGALIQAAVSMGGTLAQADTQTLKHLSDYATAIGLAFQISDDILDIEGSLAVLGKTPHTDIDRQKATYPALFGIKKAKRLLDQQLKNASQALHACPRLSKRAAFLEALALFIGRRKT